MPGKTPPLSKRAPREQTLGIKTVERRQALGRGRSSPFPAPADNGCGGGQGLARGRAGVPGQPTPTASLRNASG